MKPTPARMFASLAAVLLAVLACSCASRAPAPLPLRVGISPAYPPVCMIVQDRPGGLEADFAAALAEELRCPLEFVSMERNQLIPALLEGRVDILMSGITVTPARAMQAKFCTPYLQNPLVAAARAGQASAYASAADVLSAPTSIGILRHTSADTFVRRHCGKARAIPVSQRRDVPQNLAANRFSLYVDDLAAVLDLVAANPGVMEIVPHALYPQELAWAVHPENRDLLAAANAALAKWKASGRLDAMLDRWLPGRFR